MKYTVETKSKWAEEMTNNELIKNVETTRFLSISLSIIGTLTIICGLIHYIYAFLGIAIMIVGVEAHIRLRYLQIIKIIKNKKEEKKK